VLEGAIRSKVNDGPITVYEAGESWLEPPGSARRRGRAGLKPLTFGDRSRHDRSPLTASARARSTLEAFFPVPCLRPFPHGASRVRCSAPASDLEQPWGKLWSIVVEHARQGAVHVPGKWPGVTPPRGSRAQQKQSKQVAQYQDSLKGDQKCADCRFFIEGARVSWSRARSARMVGAGSSRRRPEAGSGKEWPRRPVSLH
jgi:hypothetical protein